MAFVSEAYQATLPGGEALVLRGLTQAELDPLLPAAYLLRRYGSLAGPPALWSEPDAELLIKYLSESENRAWGVALDGLMVGCATVEPPRWDLPYPNGSLYILDPNAWKKGVGTGTAAILAHDTFTTTNHAALVALSHPLNAASQALVRAGGAVRIAVTDNRREDTDECDLYMIPRPDQLWFNKPPELTVLQTLLARRRFARRTGSFAVRGFDAKKTDRL